MRVRKYLILIFLFFFFSTLVSACRLLLQSSELLPSVSFSYSATTARPPSVEYAILSNLFLFFILKITAFNNVETGSCSSDILSLMSWRSSIITKLNSCCSLWPLCLKISTWIFRFFSAGSLPLLFSGLILDFSNLESN